MTGAEDGGGKKRTHAATAVLIQGALAVVKRLKEAGGYPGAITITSVAAKAGVSAALIHNKYPDLAEAIRAEEGKESRQAVRVKHHELTDAAAAIAALRERLADMEAELGRYAASNYRYDMQNRELKAKVADLETELVKTSVNVVPFRPK